MLINTSREDERVSLAQARRTKRAHQERAENRRDCFQYLGVTVDDVDDLLVARIDDQKLVLQQRIVIRLQRAYLPSKFGWNRLQRDLVRNRVTHTWRKVSWRFLGGSDPLDILPDELLLRACQRQSWPRHLMHGRRLRHLGRG